MLAFTEAFAPYSKGEVRANLNKVSYEVGENLIAKKNTGLFKLNKIPPLTYFTN